MHFQIPHNFPLKITFSPLKIPYNLILILLSKVTHQMQGTKKTETLTPSASSTPDKAADKKLLTADDLFDAIKPCAVDSNEQTLKRAKDVIKKYLGQIVEANEECHKKYNILFLYDDTILVREDSNLIYNAITAFEEKKPVLLILYSKGGSIESAYLIGKLCREHSNNHFTVCVPRQAKSAATLLCCAADEIHMGSLSELGPIDPQIDRLPALGLKSSIDHIAHLVKDTPESAEMFAKYLHYSLKPIDLGYFERVAESAAQYAVRLLRTHAAKLSLTPESIAHILVYNYKDHAFVIDKEEAFNIFGNNVIKITSPEYDLGNEIYKALDLCQKWLNLCNHSFYFIGSLNSDPSIRQRN